MNRLTHSLARRAPRMADWLVYAVLLAALVFWISPQQLPVSLYKLSLVSLAAVVGYWIDRSLFPYARPDAFLALDSIADDNPETEIGFDPNAEAMTTLEAKADDVLLRLMGLAMIRRAVIVAATMLAVGLGA